MGALPALPFASTQTISLVEVSPSTLTRFSVSFTTSDRACWSSAGAMSASVVRKVRVVAMLGWIIPLPLSMPPSLQDFPPRVKDTAISLGMVSVVIIASTAAAFPLGFSPLHSSGMAAAMGSMGSTCPMTPVDATMISLSSSFKASAAS